jgi:hypothetical protein
MARFPETFCSHCGGSFGPGDSGFSHCHSHPGAVRDRLHDAAPDLYAASRNLIETASESFSGGKKYIEMDDGEKGWIVHDDVIQQVRAAIAKVEGV